MSGKSLLSEERKLIEEHMELVRNIAKHVYYTLPASYRTLDLFEELVSEGFIGLIKSAKRFRKDNKSGASFKTFATLRIKGAMYDYLRKQDLISRTDRQRVKKIQVAIQELLQKSGRMPGEKEVAKKLGITVEELRKWYNNASIIVESINESYKNKNGEEFSKENVIPSKENSPIDALYKEETKNAISEAINQLSEREKIIFDLIYCHNLNMKEVGKILNISESRVSQIHKEVIIKIRVFLKNKGIEP